MRLLSAKGSWKLQWWSEYRTSPDFQLWKVVRMSNGLVKECGLNTEEPNHLKTKQVVAILNVQSPIVGTKAKLSYSLTIWKPVTKMFGFFNVSGIWMSGIQIPTVVQKLNAFRIWPHCIVLPSQYRGDPKTGHVQFSNDSLAWTILLINIIFFKLF